jgi:hypothetical protein
MQSAGTRFTATAPILAHFEEPQAKSLSLTYLYLIRSGHLSG